MILYDQVGILEVQLAKLQFKDGHVRYFSSSDQVIAYLMARPDEKFRLDAVQTGMTLYLRNDPNKTLYGYEAGDVFCGDEIWYDTATQEVKTLNYSSRLWSG